MEKLAFELMSVLWCHRRGWLTSLVILAAGLASSGCKAVPIMEQRLVSKPNMVFSDSPVFAYQSRVVSQIEPGSAMSGGAQAAGCTACR